MLFEYNRECLALEIGYCLTAQDVVTMQRLRSQRGALDYICSANGLEFVAKGFKKWLEEAGIATLYIEPDSPWQTAYNESFSSQFRDELLKLELFTNRLEVQVLRKEYQQKYNHMRPHSALGD